MKMYAFPLALFTAAVFLSACHDSVAGPDSLHDPEGSDVGGEVFFDTGTGAEGFLPDRRGSGAEGPGAEGAAGWTRADLVAFENVAHQVGTSALRRSADRIQVRVRAGEMAPGSISTLWAVVFNNPAACVGECDDPDLFDNPATKPDLLYVAGAVTNARGRAQYAGQIRTGDASASIMPLFGEVANGVQDGHAAEIHLVVRSHGPAVSGLQRAQRTTFNGGCTGFGAEFGTPGPNDCIDLYFSSHYGPS